jgi:hypothetical protein
LFACEPTGVASIWQLSPLAGRAVQIEGQAHRLQGSLDILGPTAQLIRISLVVIDSMFTLALARAPNIRSATPNCDRMPTPMTDTRAMLSRTMMVSQ